MMNTAHPQNTSPSRCFLLLAVVLFVAFVSHLALGSVLLPPAETLAFIFGQLPADSPSGLIFREFRLPRALTAVAAGGGLAVAGLLMQTLFRNPLADPFVLGIQSGASLGVALLVMAVGPLGLAWAGAETGGSFGVVGAAFAGAAVLLLIVLAISRRVDAMTLLIVGLIIGYGVNALVGILMFLSVPDRLAAFVGWTFGDFGRVDRAALNLLLPVVAAGVVLAMTQAKALNAFLPGENFARSLGVNTGRLQWLLVFTSALLAATVTAYCGPVGFIGVAAPHLVRGLFRSSDHRIIMPGSVLAGATLALLADLVAHVPGSVLVLPLNALLALVGTPIILVVLLRRREMVEGMSR